MIILKFMVFLNDEFCNAGQFLEFILHYKGHLTENIYIIQGLSQELE